MNKLILLFFGFYFCCTTSFEQVSNTKMLFIIDSIPLFNDPEYWNPITNEDIADLTVVKNKDSLKRLGWEEMDGVTYVFTKEYRNRPDSLKRIPSLKQMLSKDGVWYLNNIIYNGRYIDYYNSGKIQNEGILTGGKLNGKLIIYFKNGNEKSVSYFKDGILDGPMNEYYKNGALMETRKFTAGKVTATEMYFINGQIQTEQKFKKETNYDTIIFYYSTGAIKQMKFIKNGTLIPDKKNDEINYYMFKFYESLNAANLKEANKFFLKLWKLDSANADILFEGGMLMINELHFDEAIGWFDKALVIEPLMRESFVYRALARIKKYQFLNTGNLSKGVKETALNEDDIISIPSSEQEKICADLQQAEYLDFSDFYVEKYVPAAILNYCQKKLNR